MSLSKQHFFKITGSAWRVISSRDFYRITSLIMVIFGTVWFTITMWRFCDIPHHYFHQAFQIILRPFNIGMLAWLSWNLFLRIHEVNQRMRMRAAQKPKAKPKKTNSKTTVKKKGIKNVKK